MALDLHKLRDRHVAAFGSIGGIKLREDKVAAYQYAAYGSYRIECLCNIKAACSSLRASHRQDIWVGGSLKHSTSACHYIYGKKECRIACRHSCGIKEHGAAGIQQQAEYDS